PPAAPPSRAVSDVELAGRIPLHPTGGELLELDPDDPLAIRRPGGIDGARLAGDDRGLGGEEAALGLVDGTRDAVEPRGDVDDRSPRQAVGVRARPPRRLVHRDVDLHPRTPVA